MTTPSNGNISNTTPLDTANKFQAEKRPPPKKTSCYGRMDGCDESDDGTLIANLGVLPKYRALCYVTQYNVTIL